ncbi:hypothetical protein V2J09_009502 [Rumex salicifolius]
MNFLFRCFSSADKQNSEDAVWMALRDFWCMTIWIITAFHILSFVWEEYKGGNLLDLIDKTLEGDFPKEEGIRFLKIGLLCVQETLSRRPMMSAALKMLKNEAEVADGLISKPGLLADLMHLKTKPSSQNTAMTSSSSYSSNPPSL